MAERMPDGGTTDDARRGEPYLDIGAVRVDARDVELLCGIDEHASINRAASELGRSYSRMQGRIVELEAELGPLVERRRGGSGGGGSSLSGTARELIDRFERLRAEVEGIARVEESVFAGEVRSRDGELGEVETAAGVVRAIVPPGADAVQVSVRSDAVTLTAPADAPDPDDTSARNRFSGRVVAVEPGEAVVRVAVDVGADDPLRALVTRESRERLDLAAGAAVVASFKATATRAVPVSR